MNHTRLSYAVTGHGSQGQTVDHIGTDLGADRDASATYVAVTRAKHSSLVVVNVQEIVEGEIFADIAKFTNEELQDWAVEYVGREIEERGHTEEITAHGALERRLFPSELTADRRPSADWQTRPYGRLLDKELAEIYESHVSGEQDESLTASPNDLGLIEAEINVRLGMDPVIRAREVRERANQAQDHQTGSAGAESSMGME